MKIAFYTLGCKTNQYETQAMERLLVELGHTIGSFDETCDGYVINTCSVTAVADKKNRAMIRRCRRDNPDAVIGVCGCYSQHDAEAVRALGADVIGGSGQRQQFVDMLPAMLLTCLMGACVYPISFLTLSDWIILPLQVITGVVVYAGLSAIFKVDSFGYILGILNRFLKKE